MDKQQFNISSKNKINCARLCTGGGPSKGLKIGNFKSQRWDLAWLIYSPLKVLYCLNRFRERDYKYNKISKLILKFFLFSNFTSHKRNWSLWMFLLYFTGSIPDSRKVIPNQNSLNADLLIVTNKGIFLFNKISRIY